MININQLSAGYPQKNVLFDVSLAIPASKVTVIVGPNGCGKSTLLKTVCGILPVRSGSISVSGRNLSEYTPTERAKHIAYLAQSRQTPDISVERLVLHGRFPYLSYPRHYREQDFQIAHEAMKRLNIDHLADTPLSALSGGTRQKVYIAMALAQDTPAILFDEPTAYLDISYQLQMMEHARFLCESGKTVVMVLHDLSLAMQVADQIAVMDRGTIVQTGGPEEIFASRCLDSVFDITVRRIRTQDKWHYYCETGGNV